MSVFHDLSNIYNVAPPMHAIGTYLNYFFVVIKLFIAVCGALTIVVGAAIAIYRYFLCRMINSAMAANINNIRLDLARTIILGLEFFIASDVIETMITPDFQALGILCVLVVIRTILNFSLHKEIRDLSAIPESGVNMRDEKNK